MMSNDPTKFVLGIYLVNKHTLGLLYLKCIAHARGIRDAFLFVLYCILRLFTNKQACVGPLRQYRETLFLIFETKILKLFQRREQKIRVGKM